MSDENDIKTDEPVRALDLIPISVILASGEVATLWWRSDHPIPPGYRVDIAEPKSRFGAQPFVFVRQH